MEGQHRLAKHGCFVERLDVISKIRHSAGKRTYGGVNPNGCKNLGTGVAD